MSDPLREKLIKLAHAQPELREDLLPILKQAGTPKTGKWKQFHPGSVPRGMEDGPERIQYLDKMVEGAVLDALKEAGQCLASVEDIGLLLDPETDNRFAPSAKGVHMAMENLEHTMKLLKGVLRVRRGRY